MATESDLRNWTANSGRDWDQLCQAWCWNICDQFGSVVATPPSAIEAYYASEIVSYDIWSAPPGSFLYMDIGVYGHVATEVDDGTGMGSARVQVPWGINAGETDLSNYLAQTGATPLGWSWDNAGNTFPYTASGGSTPPPTTTSGEIEMLFMQWRTAAKEPQTQKSLDGAIFAIGNTGIKYYNKTQWSGTTPNGGGQDAANLYGGVKVVSDASFSRTLDANGVSYNDAMAAFRNSSFVKAGTYK